MTVEAKLPNGELVTLGNPDERTWDRYIEKLINDEEMVARRELVLSCVNSHSPKDLAELIKRYPAAVKALSNGVAELAVGDVEVVEADDSVSAADCVFRGPTLDEWEAYSKALASGEKKRAETMRDLLKSLCESGDPEPLFRRHPPVVQLLTKAVGKIAGDEIQITVKKG